MELIEVFTLTIELGEPYPVGAGPRGTRIVGDIIGGSVRGDRIAGVLVGPAADWALVGEDGFAQVDVRAQILTNDGATIHVRYDGCLELTEQTSHALATGTGTDFSSCYWFTHLRLEAGDERYAWVNRSMFIAEGRAAPGGVEYRVWLAAP